MTTQTPAPDLKELLAAALHFGHQTAKWNPKMKPYIFGNRNGIHIFDLSQTAAKLTQATAFLEKSAQERKTILLVSTKQQTLESLPDLAVSLGLPYITKWYGGLLTNWNTTKQRLKHFRDLKTERDETNFAKYPKKERVKKLKEIEHLAEWFAGIEQLEKRPDVVFVVDAVRDKLAVHEANLSGLATVGIADSNCDPDTLTYPIPGNDDALKAINYVLGAVNDAIDRGQKAPAPATKAAARGDRPEKSAKADDEGTPAKEKAPAEKTEAAAKKDEKTPKKD